MLNYPGDHDSEDEVELVDNDMARSMASERIDFGTQSLLEQWRYSYENGYYNEHPYDDDMYGEDMNQDSAHMVVASKVPMLKHGEFELWRMRIEQYIQMIDYALWDVIENGNTAQKTTVVEGVEKIMPPTTAEEKA
ncbi:hypothetical protein Tco_0624777 [Tanacetum coccineum]|uniref:Uncharacterized protein n=1 Tax=Tanacetum coccineum TaxID=301880 RepID=A0ABQ4WF19_9ASTR